MVIALVGEESCLIACFFECCNDTFLLINGIEERVPQKFWDVRKPNESEDTFQELAKNFHKEYQTGIFQLIQTFKIKEEIYNISKQDLSFNCNNANCIKTYTIGKKMCMIR